MSYSGEITMNSEDSRNAENRRREIYETRKCENEREKETVINNEIQKRSETKNSQEYAELKHNETKKDMLDEHRHCMSAEQIKYLESDETKDRLTVMSVEEYCERFPDVDFSVLGHCDSEGNIYIKNIRGDYVNHISTHETMHLCSSRENSVDISSGENRILSGVHETRISREGTLISDSNRGINEGMTEMYSLRELRKRGETDAADAIDAYSEARSWAERIEKIVGDEKTADAYFGGKRAEYIDEFNRLNDNNSEAWREFSEDIDTIQYGYNEEEISAAKERLLDKYTKMIRNKYYNVEGE